MESYTKGPWTWCDFGSGPCLMAQRPKRPLVLDAVRAGMRGATVRVRVDGIMHKIEDLAEPHPDLMLIAAAPDLLEACRGLLAAASSDEVAKAISVAEAAIAKATGADQ